MNYRNDKLGDNVQKVEILDHNEEIYACGDGCRRMHGGNGLDKGQITTDEDLYESDVRFYGDGRILDPNDEDIEVWLEDTNGNEPLASSLTPNQGSSTARLEIDSLDEGEYHLCLGTYRSPKFEVTFD